MLLPAEDLVPESERYVLTDSVLGAETGLDPNALGFENSVEVALAHYADEFGSVRLALLMYPTPQLARLQTEAWLEGLDVAPPNRRIGPLLAIVTDSTSEALADTILGDLTYQTETTWNAPPVDPLTVPELILSIFRWIGVALLFTLVVGLGFGGFRAYMKARHPGVYFPSDEETHFVQLKINQPVTGKQLPP